MSARGAIEWPSSVPEMHPRGAASFTFCRGEAVSSSPQRWGEKPAQLVAWTINAGHRCSLGA